MGCVVEWVVGAIQVSCLVPHVCLISVHHAARMFCFSGLIDILCYYILCYG